MPLICLGKLLGVKTCLWTVEILHGSFFFWKKMPKISGGRKVGENGDDDPHLTLLLLTALG